MACHLGHEDVVSYFLKKLTPEMSNTLMKQTTKEFGNTVRRIQLRYNFIVDTFPLFQPLMVSVKSNRLNIAKLILSSGLDCVKDVVAIRDANGSMPLHIAVRGGLARFASLLLSAGRTDVLYAENGVGETPLETATVQWLLQATRGDFIGALPDINYLRVRGASLINELPSDRLLREMRQVEELAGNLKEGNSELADVLQALIFVLARKASEASKNAPAPSTEPVRTDEANRVETLKVISSSIFGSPGQRQLVHLADVQRSVRSSLEKAYLDGQKNRSYNRYQAVDFGETPIEKTPLQKAEQRQWEGVLNWALLNGNHPDCLNWEHAGVAAGELWLTTNNQAHM